MPPGGPLHPVSCNLHPAPCTLHPAPCTQEAPCHSSPDTLLVPLQDAIDITTSYSVYRLVLIHCSIREDCGGKLRAKFEKVIFSSSFLLQSSLGRVDMSRILIDLMP